MFTAEMADYKTICNVLKSISFKEFAIIRPLEEGLKITVEEMRCVETSVFIPNSLFKSYETRDDDVQFKIGLKVFTECLQMCGDDCNPVVKMSYRGSAHPFNLIIASADDNLTIDCDLTTLNASDTSEICLAQECDSNKVIMDAEEFSDLLSDIDIDADELELIVSPDFPNLKLTTNGILSNSSVEISKESEVVTLFECDETIKSSYAFSNIRQIFKALSLSKKVRLSVGHTGLLGLQLLINTDDGDMYVEYYVSPLYDNND